MAGLTVLLWNVWQLPSCLTDGRSCSRARLIAPLLDRYDVVILNEAFVNKSVLLAECSHRHRHRLGRRCCSVFDSGLIILSKHPVLHAAGQHYDQRSGWDVFASKGILFCRIEVGGRAVDVYATHMQAGNDAAAHAARLSQAQQVARFIRATSLAGTPVLLAGDLNMGPTLDPHFRSHSGHYANAEDARQRHEQYCALRTQCELTDVFAVATPDEPDLPLSINRFLARNVSTSSLDVKHVTFRDSKGRRLSDTEAVILAWDMAV